jgi:hypothetical protein
MTAGKKLLWIYMPLILVFSGCSNPLKKDPWAVTLDRKDKAAYGASIAYEAMKHYFPDASLQHLSQGFHYTSLDTALLPGGERSMLVAVGLDFYVSDAEISRLISFAAMGNELVIFSRTLDNKLKEKLHCSIVHEGYEDVKPTTDQNGSENKSILSLKSQPGKRFGYQGRTIRGWYDLSEASKDTSDTSANKIPTLQSIPGTDTVTTADADSVTEEENDQPEAESDTSYTYEYNDDQSATGEEDILIGPVDTLGLAEGHPDHIRFEVGAGHISLHAAPLTLSNYFLLQGDNRFYLDGVWQTLPGGIGRVYWHDYFKRTGATSDLGVLWRYPAMKWAILLALFTLIVYVFFEAKRRQRIIPVIAPLENTSVSFVETVGRLYYNKADHNNIAEKMVQHFLEWVRTRYFINTAKIDKDFRNQLRIKSGTPENVVNALADMIAEVTIERKNMDETDLYHLHNTIQQFYKKR